MDLARDQQRWHVGADIGGTFTDVIALGPDSGAAVAKVLSTPAEFHRGVIEGVVSSLDLADAAPEEVATLLHATTVATNAILEREGAPTALVTTRGFRDVLELGRLRRPSLYDLSWQKPRPLAQRRHRYELDQRIAGDGSVLRPIDFGEVRRVAEAAEAAGIKAIAVCLINAYLLPELEREVADVLRSLLPGTYVTASVDVSPAMHEFERTSTVTVNAYVGPVVRDYVGALGTGLAEQGITAPLRIMQSSGGLLDAETVITRPVQIIESGPAAGVVGVQKLAEVMGLGNVVAFDMGGTTAKASLIENGEPFVAADYEVGGGMNVNRGLGKGAGYTIRVPSIDIAEVGAGGGSLITVDIAGALHVGPESASAWPGPAVYGNGGTRPTLTDANVVLGYVSPVALAGGRVTMHPDMAYASLESVAGELQLSAFEAARGAYEIAVSNMTKAVKAVTSERGRDPRDSVMVAFGGAGPLYGAELARELGIATVVVPVHTGVFSSLGLLVADTQLELVAPATSAVMVEELAALFDSLEIEARRQVSTAQESEPKLERLLDMRYRGQRFELRVGVPDQPLDDAVMAQVRKMFHESHLRTYGRAGDDDIVEVVNARVRATTPNPRQLTEVLRIDNEGGSEQVTRTCWFDGPLDTPVIGRGDLTDVPRPGPMVVEEMDSTTLVPPGATAHLDSINNIVISWPAEEQNR